MFNQILASHNRPTTIGPPNSIVTGVASLPADLDAVTTVDLGSLSFQNDHPTFAPGASVSTRQALDFYRSNRFEILDFVHSKLPISSLSPDALLLLACLPSVQIAYLFGDLQQMLSDDRNLARSIWKGLGDFGTILAATSIASTAPVLGAAALGFPLQTCLIAGILPLVIGCKLAESSWTRTVDAFIVKDDFVKQLRYLIDHPAICDVIIANLLKGVPNRKEDMGLDSV